MDRSEPATPRRRSGFRFPWRSLLVLLVLLGVVRVFFCALLRVPTASMEPGIHGDPVRGDELLVFNPWFRLFAPDRFDVACFERPGEGGEGKLNVKRIVGLPGESIRTADGDLYVTAPGSSVEKMVEKTYDEFRPLLVRRFFARFGDRFDDDFDAPGAATVEPGGVLFGGGGNDNQPSEIALKPSAVTIDDGWIDARGVDHAGGTRVKDVLFDLEVTPLSESTCFELKVRIADCDMTFQIVPLAAGEQITISVNPGSSPPLSHQQPVRFLSTGKKHRIEFFQIDGNAGAAIDGRSEMSVDLPATGLVVGEGAQGVQGAVFSTSAGSARLTRFEIWRDLYYSEPGDATFGGHSSPCRIPEDQVFVLGDNSRESNDSRYYGPIPLKDLRGCPILIVEPTSRFGLVH